MDIRPRALLCAALAFTVTTGCTGDAADKRPRHPDVKLVEPGALTVCTELPYPPFEERRGDQIVGFDVDLMGLVATELGVPLKMRETAFEGIRSGQSLDAGECDAAAAAIPTTPEPPPLTALSDSYFDVRQAILVKAGKPYRSLADLKGKKVGVLGGTAGETYVEKQNTEHKLSLKILSYEDLEGQQQGLVTGQVEAAVHEQVFWAEFLDSHPGQVEVAAELDTGQRYAVAVRKGNTALLAVIDDVLSKARTDGSYDRIYQKWFGRKPPRE